MREIVALRMRVAGQVQGVGFRPFVYRLACELGVTGWVRNRSGTVEILAQSDPATLNCFREHLIHSAPPLASPEFGEAVQIESVPTERFDIVDSDGMDASNVHLPVDQFTCGDCLLEMDVPDDRRYRYPFINCTQCGPRYTLIDKLPYDRRNTSMSEFGMCRECEQEYLDPADRRFHAEPIACSRCGPALTYVDQAVRITDTESALQSAVGRLRLGSIIAVRGIGGYHLLCDASDEQAVARLRRRKRRPHKPLAVMVPQAGGDLLAGVRDVAQAGAEQARYLLSPRRPIVLCGKLPSSSLAQNVASRLGEVGIFLPYSPLHHLILNDFSGPLVATSGNISGEPVLTDPEQAQARLARVADAFLHHNRDIRRPADDTVLRSSQGRMRPVRLGRGYAPVELKLAEVLPMPLLAAGGHMKNTVSLAWRDRVVISPHIGDLESPRSKEVFKQVIEDLRRVYDVEPDGLVCDMHPQYVASEWARSSAKATGKKCFEVFHHHAHASAVYGEFACEEDILVFTWDGTGYGEDGLIWGGEGLFGVPGQWHRVSSFAPFALPGAVMAGRDPWRSAAALCWAAGYEFVPDIEDFAGGPSSADLELARKAWNINLNTSISTAAGRLFDAAACLIGLCASASFEGQAPMWLEAAAMEFESPWVSALPLERDMNGVWRADWRQLVKMCMESQRPVPERAAMFHEKMAMTLLHKTRRVREERCFKTVGLSGGVFQNRILVERAHQLLSAEGFEVLIPQRIPLNDAGLGFGQLVEAAANSGCRMVLKAER